MKSSLIIFIHNLTFPPSLTMSLLWWLVAIVLAKTDAFTTNRNHSRLGHSCLFASKRQAVSNLWRKVTRRKQKSNECETGTTPGNEVLPETVVDSSFDSAPQPSTADELWDKYREEEAVLLTNPSDRDSMRRCADALCRWMRVVTDGQTVTLDGPGDSLENRKVWGEHAPRCVDIYRGLLLDKSDPDPDLLCNFIECISSQSAAKGVAVAAISGDAVSFLKNVATLKATYPEHNGGLAFIFTSAFYLAAPFPVRSPSRAIDAARMALEADPTSRRNRYYVGLAAWGCSDIATAGKYFASALAADVTSRSQSERDIDGALVREATRGLVAVQDRGGL